MGLGLPNMRIDCLTEPGALCTGSAKSGSAKRTRQITRTKTLIRSGSALLPSRCACAADRDDGAASLDEAFESLSIPSSVMSDGHNNAVAMKSKALKNTGCA